jgi:long-chain acyl-CoA synthetase
MAPDEAAAAAGGQELADLVPRLAQLTDGAVHYLDGATLVRQPYPALQADVRRVQERLADAQVTAGSRVGIWGANSYAWVVHELALLDLGCVSVTLPVAELAGASAAQLAERYDLELLLADQDRYAAAGEPAPDWLVPLSLSWDDDRKVTLRRRAPALSPDVFSVVFSSGTTGAVKAIQISRAATEDCLAEFARHYAFRPDDAILVGLPLSTFQQRIMLYCAIWYGFDAIVVEPSPLMFMVMKQARPTIMGGPPAFYEILESRFTSQPAPLRAALRALSRIIRTALPGPAREAALRRLFRQAHDAYGGRMHGRAAALPALRAHGVRLHRLEPAGGQPGRLGRQAGIRRLGADSWRRRDHGALAAPAEPGLSRRARRGGVRRLPPRWLDRHGRLRPARR